MGKRVSPSIVVVEEEWDEGAIVETDVLEEEGLEA